MGGAGGVESTSRFPVILALHSSSNCYVQNTKQYSRCKCIMCICDVCVYMYNMRELLDFYEIYTQCRCTSIHGDNNEEIG